MAENIRRVGNYQHERVFGEPAPPSADFSGLFPPAKAQTALKLAISHIEHMAAFITRMNAGYSFEALGEDMPTIKAGLTPPKGRPDPMTQSKGSFRPQAGSIPSESVLNWRDVYPGQWTFDGISYLWADSLKGGQTTPAQVRGYGYLTGRGDGALALSDEDAGRIQRQVGQLLAAAPALLEALKRTTELLASANRSTDRPSDTVWLAVSEARAAIQSATGEG